MRTRTLTGWALGAVVVVAGCKADAPPTPWEIIGGTASLADSKAVTPTSIEQIVDYPTRTGSITVASDSSVTGWIKFSAADSESFTGTVSAVGDSLIMTLTGLTPSEYAVGTSPDFVDTYALLSTAVINSDVTGDGTPEQHRLYWEFHR